MLFTFNSAGILAWNTMDLAFNTISLDIVHANIMASQIPPPLKKNEMLFQLSCVCVIAGEQENIEKFTKRLVKVTKQHNDECKKLLTLMGVPFVEVEICCPFSTSQLKVLEVGTGSYRYVFISLFWGPGSVRS